MKTLKFSPPLVKLILIREKTSTWRLFDDKNLRTGDEVKFINSSNLEVFGHGVITNVVSKTFATLTEEDWDGHEHFAIEAEMLATYSGYYRQSVTSETGLKILHFNFDPLI